MISIFTTVDEKYLDDVLLGQKFYKMEQMDTALYHKAMGVVWKSCDSQKEQKAACLLFKCNCYRYKCCSLWLNCTCLTRSNNNSE